jgi:hypothetical protein
MIEVHAVVMDLPDDTSPAEKPATFTDTDRAVHAGLLHRLSMDKLRHVLLLVRPDTILLAG